jgi:hypothetical protein
MRRVRALGQVVHTGSLANFAPSLPFVRVRVHPARRRCAVLCCAVRLAADTILAYTQFR